jgi:hypothetical protein
MAAFESRKVYQQMEVTKVPVANIEAIPAPIRTEPTCRNRTVVSPKKANREEPAADNNNRSSNKTTSLTNFNKKKIEK